MSGAGDDPGGGDRVRVVVSFDALDNEVVDWLPAAVADQWDARIWGRLR